MLSNIVVASLKPSTYEKVRLGISLAAALLLNILASYKTELHDHFRCGLAWVSRLGAAEVGGWEEAVRTQRLFIGGHLSIGS